MPDAQEALPQRDLLFRNSKGKICAAPDVSLPVADTHAHLDLLADPALSLARCAGMHIGFICNVVDPSENTDAYSFLDAWMDGAREQIARWALDGMCAPDGAPASGFTLPKMRLAVGVHPHNARLFTLETERLLLRCAADPRTSCIGEIGLDYHYDLSPRPLQREVFEIQLKLARQVGLPVALHIREAHTDALQIIERVGLPDAGCILHCFNLDAEGLAPWLELGCHIALGGPLTFKKSDYVREAAVQIPLDRLLTETDSPFMAPEPLRGTPCSPEYTLYTAALLARIFHAEHGLTQDQVLDAAYRNALALLDRQAVPWQEDASAQEALAASVCCCLGDGESATL